MGLLSGLLGLPLAPLRGVGWVLEQVVQEAERQYFDPAPIHPRRGSEYRSCNQNTSAAGPSPSSEVAWPV
jgi:hypothetical protein